MKRLHRIAGFLLPATSIGCLLSQMYGLWPMRQSTLAIFMPSCCTLVALALYDRWCGNGHLSHAMGIGAVAGLTATAAYDVFRLPFVCAANWGLDGVLTVLPLFKVFPQFGAMILGVTDVNSLAAHAIFGVTLGLTSRALAERAGEC